MNTFIHSSAQLFFIISIFLNRQRPGVDDASSLDLVTVKCPITLKGPATRDGVRRNQGKMEWHTTVHWHETNAPIQRAQKPKNGAKHTRTTGNPVAARKRKAETMCGLFFYLFRLYVFPSEIK